MVPREVGVDWYAVSKRTTLPVFESLWTWEHRCLSKQVNSSGGPTRGVVAEMPRSRKVPLLMSLVLAERLTSNPPGKPQ